MAIFGEELEKVGWGDKFPSILVFLNTRSELFFQTSHPYTVLCYTYYQLFFIAELFFQTRTFLFLLSNLRYITLKIKNGNHAHHIINQLNTVSSSGSADCLFLMFRYTPISIVSIPNAKYQAINSLNVIYLLF